jgi:hypothetical protein
MDEFIPVIYREIYQSSIHSIRLTGNPIAHLAKIDDMCSSRKSLWGHTINQLTGYEDLCNLAFTVITVLRFTDISMAITCIIGR